MIKSNELRIGNRIKVYKENFYKVSVIDEEIEVKNIHTTGITIIDERYDLSVRNFYEDALFGIELTPEFLKKCGFKKEGEWGVIRFDARMEIRFYNFNYAECDIIQDDKFIGFKNSHIKYLHQLQNLYFALSGQELEIKLP